MTRLAFVFLLLAGHVAAAPLVPRGPVELPNTERVDLESPVNGVTYRLLVSVPEGFEGSEARYPVVYLLDADYSFAIARNVVEHHVQRDRMPETIVVAIGYAGDVTRASYRLNRSRDYTPTPTTGQSYDEKTDPVTGGASAFLETLVDHIVPAIEERYRGSGERILVGHSFGGLFSVWATLERPDVFPTILTVSPSLWYDDQLVLERIRRATPERLEGRRVFGMVGSREGNSTRRMVPDLRELGVLLEPVLGEDVRIDVADGETHDSVFPRAVSTGLRWLVSRRR